MLGIRHKLMLGFGTSVAVVGVLGVLIMHQVQILGQAIDVILRENYRSVVACQEMKESLERVDSGLLFTLSGYEDEGRATVMANQERFLKALDAEAHNLTLPTEDEKVKCLQGLFADYQKAIPQVLDPSRDLETRRVAYHERVFPTFLEIRDVAQGILDLNQKNMMDANDRARRLAASAHGHMFMSILSCAAVAILFSLAAGRSILRPIHSLIDSAHDIRQGQLDLVIEPRSKDEMGQLSLAFNEMAEALRQTRRSERLQLARSQRASEEIIRSMPDPIAVLDLDGRVEMASEMASRHFGLKHGTAVQELSESRLSDLFHRALTAEGPVACTGDAGLIQRFIENEERFYQPTALPILSDDREPTGVILVLKDLTQAQSQLELKKDLVSTLSHQLKTPLTSLRMSIHLLLTGTVGAVNERQADLLLAARDESERLSSILEDLLDISRIKSGKVLDLRPVFPHLLLQEETQAFAAEAKDKGVALETLAPVDLPEVQVDPVRIHHVFLNLLANASRFTQPGGRIVVKAEPSSDGIRFSVADNGPGVPQEHASRIFEPFFRVPGQDEASGAGLGLSIAKGIVEAHQGRIGVEGEQGQGATFWFTLPAWHGSDP